MARGFLSENKGPRGGTHEVTVTVILKRDHELSWGVYKPTAWGDMIWLPKSMVKLVGGEQPECKARCTMPSWLAIKKGLA